MEHTDRPNQDDVVHETDSPQVNDTQKDRVKTSQEKEPIAIELGGQYNQTQFSKM